MLIYFHIDELARDAIAASALRHELEARGGRLVYGNRFTTDYLLRHANIFDAIILPSLLHFYYAFPNAKKLPHNVFILQTEAIGQSTKTLKRLNGKYFGDEPGKYDPWHKAVCGYLLWGEAHLNPFHEHHPEYLPKCKVVGHPRLARLCAPPKITKTDPRPAVGFVSRFNMLSPFDGRTPFESAVNSMRHGNKVMSVYEGSGDKDVEDMFYTEVIDFRVMLQIMRSLDANKYRLFVRPHPRENRGGWQRLAKKLGLNITVSKWDVPFAHWLAELDYIITPPSTGLYDIFFHGKRPIVIDKIVPTRNEHTLAQSDDNNQILENLCRPTSIAEVIQRIETNDIPPADDNVRGCLQSQVGADIAADAMANIIAAIASLTPAKPRPAWQIKLWDGAVLALSELKELKRRLQRRMEQGSSFNLTFARKKWIDNLIMRHYETTDQ
jgi:hypothetical protein